MQQLKSILLILFACSLMVSCGDTAIEAAPTAAPSSMIQEEPEASSLPIEAEDKELTSEPKKLHFSHEDLKVVTLPFDDFSSASISQDGVVDITLELDLDGNGLTDAHDAGVSNLNGDIIFPFGNRPQQHVLDSGNIIISPAGSGGNVALFDKDGTQLTDALYNQILPHDSDPIIATKKISGDYYYGLLDNEGNELTDFCFTDIKSFSDGLAAAAIDRKYGYINRLGEFVIEPQYYFGNPFSDGVALQMHPKEDPSDPIILEVIDHEGKVLASKHANSIREPLFALDGNFSEGLVALSSLEDAYEPAFGQYVSVQCFIYLDQNLNIAFDRTVSEAHRFHNGLARVTIDSMPHVIDTKGNIIAKEEYLATNDNGLIIAGRAPEGSGFQFGLMDRDGADLTPFEYGQIRPFSEGLAFARSGKLWGILDADGNVVVDFIYSQISSFQNGYAVVKVAETGDVDVIQNPLTIDQTNPS